MIKYGANLQDADDRGMTPLMIACQVGRIENARLIVAELQSKEHEISLMGSNRAKMGTAGVNRQAQDSWSALFYAVNAGHMNIVKFLVEECEANVERQLNAANGRKTVLMVAAARGDLEMTKYLLERCKALKLDRYKRTVLTHACMNGSSAVTSHLLKMGMPLNKSDSSGNSDLHYAAAYGWRHCVEALVEAGADLNAANEWKLTATAAAVRRGHRGIVEYLLRQPGVDVNARDDDGRSILLALLADADAGQDMPLSQGTFEEVADLVENRGADVKMADNLGKNALHFLCSYNCQPPILSEEEESTEDYAKKWEAAFALRKKFVDFFVKHKCPLLARDEQGKFPVEELIQNPLEEMTDRKDSELILHILQSMKDEAANIKGKLCFDSEELAKKPNLLNTFCDAFSLEYASEDFKIMVAITSFLKSLDAAYAIEPSLQYIVENTKTIDGQQLTPLMALCYNLTKEKPLSFNDVKDDRHANVHFKGLEWDEESGMLKDLDSKWRLRLNIVSNFIESFRPKLSYNVDKQVYDPQTKQTVTRPCTISALAILSHIPNEPKNMKGKAFEMMLKLTKDPQSVLNSTDETGKTTLNRAVLAGITEQAEKLLEAGCDVDAAYLSTQATLKIKEEEVIYLKSCAIADAVERGQLAMVK